MPLSALTLLISNEFTENGEECTLSHFIKAKMVDRIMMRSAENHTDRYKVYRAVKDQSVPGPKDISEGVEQDFGSQREEKVKEQSKIFLKNLMEYYSID